MNKQTKISLTIGTLPILSGIIVPSSMIVESLRTSTVSKELLEQLILGATLFKIGLIVLGILIIMFGRMDIRRSKIKRKDDGLKIHRKVILGGGISSILFVAFAMRLYGIQYGLWYDEIRALIQYMGLPFGEILTTYDSENNHILFTILARACFGIFDENTWSIRLPAVLFGVGSIWALYLLAREVSSTREALLSAALLAFSYHHIWFSQNARGYTGLLFWTILASWLFLKGLKENSRIFWILYAVAAALGVYTHMTMIFVVMGHFVLYAATFLFKDEHALPEKLAGFLLGFCLAGFLTLLLYSFVLPQVFENVGQQSNVAAWKNPLWTILELINGIKVTFVGSIISAGALFLTLAGIIGYARENPLIIGFLFIPSLIGSALVLGMGHPLWPRFFFFAMGFGVLIVVRGTTIFGQILARVFNRPAEQSGMIGVVLCSTMIIASIFSVPRAYAPKQDYEGALEFVQHHKKPGDAVITVGLTRFPYRSYLKTDWKEVETRDEITVVRTNSNRTWLLYTLPLHIQGEYPEIMNSIEQDFKLIKSFYGTLNGGSIYVCLSDNS